MLIIANCIAIRYENVVYNILNKTNTMKANVLTNT